MACAMESESPNELGVGKILLIFYDKSTASFKDTIIEALQVQSTDIDPSDDPKFSPGRTVIVRPDEKCVVTYTPAPFHAEKVESELKLISTDPKYVIGGIQDALTAIYDVDLLIIDSIFAEPEHIPFVQDWIEVILDVYGDLSDMRVVLGLDVDHLRTLGFSEVSDFQDVVTLNLKDAYKPKIIYTSMIG